MRKKYYLGLAITYHDPALSIVDNNGKVVFAEATERYLQYKRALNCEPDSMVRLPGLLKQHCPDMEELVVVFNWSRPLSWVEKLSTLLGYSYAEKISDPKFTKLCDAYMESYKVLHMMTAQRSSFSKRGINLARQLQAHFPKVKVSWRYCSHHLAHAASACYTSPFPDGVCLVVDSFGQKGSIAYFGYQNGKISLLLEQKGGESLGFLYMKLTELCGFDWLKGEEWKVMGMAAYGEYDPEIDAMLQPLMAVENGKLKQSFPALKKAISQLQQWQQSNKENFQARANLAYTGQDFFRRLMNQLVTHAYSYQLSNNLILAGGCALNSSYNGKIVAETPFDKLHVPSAPADDGCALGGALWAYHEDNPLKQPAGEYFSPYLGSLISKTSLNNMVKFGKIPHLRHLPNTICQETARLLAEGKLVGWMQGKAEFGPRALGNRSILADPRQPTMKDEINARVKFREEFRPFAPSILHEHGPEYFVDYQDSPYMERTLRFQEHAKGKVPAVVHEDGTGRLQSVCQDRNPRFYRLIRYFYEISQVPVLLNTSFNIMGKPIIHSIEDALSVFYTTGLDVLVIGDYLIEKEEN